MHQSVSTKLENDPGMCDVRSGFWAFCLMRGGDHLRPVWRLRYGAKPTL